MEGRSRVDELLELSDSDRFDDGRGIEYWILELPGIAIRRPIAELTLFYRGCRHVAHSAAANQADAADNGTERQIGVTVQPKQLSETPASL